MLWNPYDDTNYEGPSNFDRRHVLSIYYIYDLPFWREPTNLRPEPARRLADLRCDVHAHRHAVHDHADRRHRAGIGDGSISQPIDIEWRSQCKATNGKFSGGVNSGVAADDNFCFNPEAFSQVPAGAQQVREHAPQHRLRNPAISSGTSRSSRTSTLAGTHKVQFRVEMFNFINHPNLSGPNTDITNANFGRIITKYGRSPRHSARACATCSRSDSLTAGSRFAGSRFVLSVDVGPGS